MLDAKGRAGLSEGRSQDILYEMVAKLLRGRLPRRGTVIDVGCGVGALWSHLTGVADRYIGVDVVSYEEFPAECEYVEVDLNNLDWPIPDKSADAVVAIETIEHLENPRAFMREVTRLAKPNGLVLITTPNQLSLLSKLTLLLKNEFNQFQERPGLYPSHITALLESDVRRIAGECGLIEVEVIYNLRGRLALTQWSYPMSLSKIFPRACSDNMLLLGRTPAIAR